MNLTLLKGYPDFIGKRQAWAGYGNGPSSYVAGGDPIVLPQYGGYIDAVFGPVYSVSGNYLVTPIPSGAGPRQTWKLKWSPAQLAGTPLVLGPTQAVTKTQWAESGVTGTITAANTLSPGQFVMLNSFTSSHLIFMNGQIVEVASATSSSFTFLWGPAGANGTVAFSNVAQANDAGTFQVLQSANGLPVQLSTLTGTSNVATITGCAVTGGLLTVTATNNFSVGNFVYIAGTAANEVTLGIWGQILSATSSAFTMATQCKNVSNASDSGTATLMVTGNNQPISTGTPVPVYGSTIAASIVSTSAAGTITLPAYQNWNVNNLFIVQGLTFGGTIDGSVAQVTSSSLSNVLINATTFIGVAVITGTLGFGTAALLTVGGPSTTYGEMPAGTNLSGEQVQIGGFGGQF
jgi:hypothetical protein